MVIKVAISSINLTNNFHLLKMFLVSIQVPKRKLLVLMTLQESSIGGSML